MKKLLNAIIGATLLVSLIEIAPATAASFQFSSFGGGCGLPCSSGGGGSLNFEGSNLKGTGIEIAKLSELENAFFGAGSSLIVHPPGGLPGRASFGWEGDPVFTFNSGELIGMNFSSPPSPISFAVRLPPPVFGVLFTGQASWSVQGQRDFYGVNGTYCDRPPFLPGSRCFPASFGVGGGSIQYRTLEPVRQVPESSLSPLALGVAIAIGFGTFFKVL